MIPPLQERAAIAENQSIQKELRCLQLLLDAINRKTMPVAEEATITEMVQHINHFDGTLPQLGDLAKQTHKQVLQLLEKNLKMVPKKHNMKKWMAIGIALGLPFGIVYATALGNMAFLGLGIPIGMCVGIGIGTSMDKKAESENRQLDIEYSSGTTVKLYSLS